MTSSNLPRRRRRSVLIFWFAVLIVLIGVAYTFAWMRLADVVRSRVEGTLAALRATGATAAAADRPPPPRRASISFCERVSEVTATG